MLETGIRGKQSVAVTPENTAKTMGSGTLNVFATPALVALAEKTCWMSVADALDEGCGSVAGVQGLPARRERPRGRRRPRALCGQRRKVCRQGREQEGLRLFFLGKLDGRRVGSQQLLLGPGLSFLQKPCRLFAGTEQL